MIARLGLRLAMSRSPEHRWRQFALPAAVAVSLLAVLLLPGLIQMAERQKSRMENRAPAIARTYSPGDLLMTPRADAPTPGRASSTRSHGWQRAVRAPRCCHRA